MNRKKSLVFGRRTGKNVLEGKKIRKLEDGGGMFEDYWTDDESSASSECAANKSEIPSLDIETPKRGLIKTYSRPSNKVYIKSFAERTCEKISPLDSKRHCGPENCVNILQTRDNHELEDRGNMFQDDVTDKNYSVSNESKISTPKTKNSTKSVTAHLASPERVNTRSFVKSLASAERVNTRSFVKRTLEKTFKKSASSNSVECFGTRTGTNISQNREICELENDRTCKKSSTLNESEIPRIKNSKRSVNTDSTPSRRAYSRSCKQKELEKTSKKLSLSKLTKINEKDAQMLAPGSNKKEHFGSTAVTNIHLNKEIHEFEDGDCRFEDDRTEKESSTLNESEMPMKKKRKKNVNADSVSSGRVYTRSLLKKILEKSTKKISPSKVEKMNEKASRMLVLGLKEKKHFGSRAVTNIHPSKEIHKFEDGDHRLEDGSVDKESCALNETEREGILEETSKDLFKSALGLRKKEHHSGSQKYHRRSSRLNGSFIVMGKSNNKNSNLFESLHKKYKEVNECLSDTDECSLKTKAAKEIQDDKSKKSRTQERYDVPNQGTLGDTVHYEQAVVSGKVFRDLAEIIFPPKTFTLPSCFREPEKLSTTFVKEEKVSGTLNQKDMEEASKMDNYDSNAMEMADENERIFTKSTDLTEVKSLTHDFSTVECEQDSFGNSSPKIVNKNTSNISKKKSPKKFPSDSQNFQDQSNSSINVRVKRKVSGISECSNKKVKQNLNVSNTEYPVMDDFDSKIMEIINENDSNQTYSILNASGTVTKNLKTARKLFSSSVAGGGDIEKNDADDQAKAFNEESETSNKRSCSSEVKNLTMQSSPQKVGVIEKVASFSKECPSRTPKKQTAADEQCTTIANEAINSENSGEDTETCEAEDNYQVEGQENHNVISKTSPHKDLHQGSFKKVTFSKHVTTHENILINSNSSQYSNHNGEELDKTEESEIIKCTKSKETLKQSSPKRKSANIKRNLNSSQHPDVNEEIHEADASTESCKKPSEGNGKSYDLDNVENAGGEEIHRKAEATKRKSVRLEQQDLNETETLKEPVTLNMPLSKRSKKNKKKEILQNTSNNLNVRKSSRQRFAPVAHWLNQRLLYRFEDGIPVVCGFQKGLEYDDTAVKSHEENSSEKTKNLEKEKKKHTQKEKAKLLHSTKKKEMYIKVAKYYQNIPWITCSDEESSEGYMVKKIFDTKDHSVGFIKIKPGKVKALQYMPDQDLQFMVVVGKVEVTFQGNSFNLESRDFILIPKRNAYFITNVGSKSAILQYSVGNYI